MKKAILLTLFLIGFAAMPAFSQEVDFATNGFVAMPVNTQAAAGSLTALTGQPAFLAPVQQWDSASFLGPTTAENEAAAASEAAAAANDAPDSSFAGTPYESASQGDAMHTTSTTGEGPQGTAPNTTSTTGPQNAGLNLPVCCYGIL